MDAQIGNDPAVPRLVHKAFFGALSSEWPGDGTPEQARDVHSRLCYTRAGLTRQGPRVEDRETSALSHAEPASRLVKRTHAGQGEPYRDENVLLHDLFSPVGARVEVHLPLGFVKLRDGKTIETSVWCTDAEGLAELRKDPSGDADALVDALALPRIRENEDLIEIRYARFPDSNRPDLAQNDHSREVEIRRPLCYDAAGGLAWRPSPADNEWGVTCPRRVGLPALKEAVHEAITLTVEGRQGQAVNWGKTKFAHDS